MESWYNSQPTENMANFRYFYQIISALTRSTGQPHKEAGQK